MNRFFILYFFYVLLVKPQKKAGLVQAIQKRKGILQKFAQFLYLQDQEEFLCFKPFLYNGTPISNHKFHSILKPLEQNGVYLSPIPAKSGSMGQIYEGIYNDQTIILKCLLPKIKEQTKKEIAIMKKTISLLFSMFRLPNKKTLLNYLSLFEATIESETDYIQEGNNMEKFNRLNNFHNIYIPSYIRELSNEHVIAQTKCLGRPIEEYMENACMKNRISVIHSLFTFYFSFFLEHGLLHGDPHFGNFFIEERDDHISLQVIDFGCIQKFDPQFIVAFKKLIKSLRIENNEDAFQLLEALGFETQDIMNYRQLILPLLYTLFEPFLVDEPFDFRNWSLRYTLNTIMGSKIMDKPLTLPDNFLLLFRVFNGCLAYLTFTEDGCFSVYHYIKDL